jgi:hypothetical protein
VKPKYRTCTCDGSNANCFRCGGRGFIGWPEPHHGSKPGRRDRAVGTSKGADPGLSSLIRKPPRRSPAPAASPAGNQTPRPEDNLWLRRRLVVCPICSVKVKAQRLAKHLRVAHPGASDPTLKQSAPASSKPKTPAQTARLKKTPAASRLQFTCPLCGAQISTKRARRHLADNHRVSKNEWLERVLPGSAPAVTSRKASSHASTAGDEAGISPTQEQLNESRLDGSKGRHTFRETGRFGSYPVHDNYNDESEP